MEYVNDKVFRWGEHDQGAIDQIQKCSWDGRTYRGALLADGHKGYSMPVGGVMAYRGHISPSGVGYDISCGCKAVKLNIKKKDIEKDIEKIMDEIQSSISFGVGRVNDEKIEHELFESETWKLNCFKEISKVIRSYGKSQNKLKDLAAEQLGTVGSGNHYTDIFYDEDENIWIGVHFGSRGLGHKIASYFLLMGGGKDEIDAYPCLIPENTALGEDYIQCMNLAGEYAYAGRDWVCSKIANIIGAEIIEEIHNHHNFAWKEEFEGEKVWVVRKGATPAYPGQKGFVGGSMGDKSVILEGVESEEAKFTLYSTVHGAGRIMGRMEAKGKKKKIKDEDGKVIGYEWKREPKIKLSDMNKWLKKANVVLRGGDVDESPFVYKRIEEVLEYHKNTIKILHWLTPMGVCMAGENIRDPYKD